MNLSQKLGRKVRGGNRYLKSSAFGWHLESKDLIRSPREKIKPKKRIEFNTRPQSSPFLEVSQRAGEEETGKEGPGRKPREYSVTGGKRRMYVKKDETFSASHATLRSRKMTKK